MARSGILFRLFPELKQRKRRNPTHYREITKEVDRFIPSRSSGEGVGYTLYKGYLGAVCQYHDGRRGREVVSPYNTGHYGTRQLNHRLGRLASHLERQYEVRRAPNSSPELTLLDMANTVEATGVELETGLRAAEAKVRRADAFLNRMALIGALSGFGAALFASSLPLAACFGFGLVAGLGAYILPLSLGLGERASQQARRFKPAMGEAVEAADGFRNWNRTIQQDLQNPDPQSNQVPPRTYFGKRC